MIFLLLGLCGLVSSDGTVGCYYCSKSNSQKKYPIGILSICTAEENWAKQITKIIEKNGLSCHMSECHRDRPMTTNGRWRTEFRINIHKYRPKMARTGINQWQKLVEAIEKYKLEYLMIPRKLATLKKIANLGHKPTKS